MASTGTCANMRKLAKERGIARACCAQRDDDRPDRQRPDGRRSYVETGRTYLDGTVQIGAMDGVVRDRIRMALNGHVVVTVILDEDDEPLGDPWCELMGLPETGSRTRRWWMCWKRISGSSWDAPRPRPCRMTTELEKEIRRIVRQTARTRSERNPR